jgi:hypothetical protein
MKSILSLLICLALGATETNLIPVKYSTIQKGMDALVVGDTVLVSDGDYVEQASIFTETDIYVDSNIDQECMDEDCGFSDNPFKTITRTL